ncbi:unnamed protein product [Paramecium sonneborni]|uniref:Uncharacterized protein n=1 Tax=Paramecium sonneborni TaxID=65129 RepID=A0A8S1QSE7_9CILI|nr:unnamed protein product [Paramecium sonneborni]
MLQEFRQIQKQFLWQNFQETKLLQQEQQNYINLKLFCSVILFKFNNLNTYKKLNQKQFAKIMVYNWDLIRQNQDIQIRYIKFDRILNDHNKSLFQYIKVYHIETKIENLYYLKEIVLAIQIYLSIRILQITCNLDNKFFHTVKIIQKTLTSTWKNCNQIFRISFLIIMLTQIKSWFYQTFIQY